MALSSTDWQEFAVLSRELSILRREKVREERTIEEQAVIDYFKKRIEVIEEKKKEKVIN
jgi:hypothetical protein